MSHHVATPGSGSTPGPVFTVDLHVHTAEVSACAVSPADEIVRRSADVGMDAVCITDHLIPDEIAREPTLSGKSPGDFVKWLASGYEAARGAARDLARPLRVFFGFEYRMPGTGNDFLVFGLEPEQMAGLDLRTAEPSTLRRFADAARLVICQAHPFRSWSGCYPIDDRGFIDAVEIHNGNWNDRFLSQRTALWAGRMDRPGIGGSDAHHEDMAGNAATCLAGPIESPRDLTSAIVGDGIIGCALRSYNPIGWVVDVAATKDLDTSLTQSAALGLQTLIVELGSCDAADVTRSTQRKLRRFAGFPDRRLLLCDPSVTLESGGLRHIERDVALSQRMGAHSLMLPAVAARERPTLGALAEELDGGITLALNMGDSDVAPSSGPVMLDARTAQDFAVPVSLVERLGTTADDSEAGLSCVLVRVGDPTETGSEAAGDDDVAQQVCLAVRRSGYAGPVFTEFGTGDADSLLWLRRFL